MTIYTKEEAIGKKINPKISWINMVYKNIKFNSYHKIKNLIHHGTLDFFRRIEVETNTYCNRRCHYCPNSKYDRGLKKNKKLMKKRTFYKLINELSEIGFDGTLGPVFYGEPLLDKRLPNLMEYARKKLPSAKLSISTNGDYLTLDLYKRLIKSIHVIGITQHSLQMPANVKKVLEYRKQHGKEGVRISYDIINNEPLFNRGGLLEIKSSRLIKRKRCEIPTETITINYAGNVSLCCNDYFSVIKWGNIEKERLLDIWNKSNFKRLRRRLRKGIFDLKICKGCAGIKNNSNEVNNPN